jgi:ectoine hydroxylase-related dioxygenase (phytanoyl-CoA dioxygenase family)
MRGLFLRSDAAERISGSRLDPSVKQHCLAVLENGYTIIPQTVPTVQCQQTIDDFHAIENANRAVFAENRDPLGHYPRIVNLHLAIPSLLRLFTGNTGMLQVLDALFGEPAALYTSLFYQVGSQQDLHRDTPVFSTRPEYLYFGATVYLEPADEANGRLEVLERGHTVPEPDRQAMARARFGSPEAVPDFDQDLWNDYQATVVADCRRRGLVSRPLTVGTGDAVIWHPQAPHGGTPIGDPARTRFSLVMHITPVGVPVYHMPAFFNPTADFPDRARWTYFESHGRQIVNHPPSISFGHVRDYPLDRFHMAAPADPAPRTRSSLGGLLSAWRRG